MRKKRRDQSKGKEKEKEDIAFLCLNSEEKFTVVLVPSALNCPIPAFPDKTLPDQETGDGETAYKLEVD